MSGEMDILVVHIGAGLHNPASTHRYKTLIRTALSQSSILESSRVIESSPLTNTGYGSSLNVLGRVECDASFIRGEKIGAVVGMLCRHPILETFRVFEHLRGVYASEPDLTLPVMLTYPSLKDVIPGIHEHDDAELISPKSQKVFDMHKDRVFQSKEIEQLPHGISDTVGLIHIQDETTTLATSSGGNSFKLPGRIGCAGMLGAGIAFKESGDVKVSCMCSGNGEQIMRCALARTIVDRVGDVLEEMYGECIDGVLSLLLPDVLYVGFIVVVQRGTRVLLVYGHTTESFHFGFRYLDKTKVVLSYAEQEGKLTFGEYVLSS
ncbi:Threonine aspartase 1 [Candida viswanathii]|uniref:Threonine aspartase 1 n=1 Tax=Candida viswanathii TaxID=5486 RepID=A0A367XNZ6_9ASCO|nr:Threonine aspartase 1 [Candida viswanathii]